MTRTASPSLLLLCLTLAAPAARAQVEGDTWVDPTLEAAVRGADLIVLAECTEVARGGGAAYRVAKTFKGPLRDGKEVLVVGLEVPGAPQGSARAVSAGDKAYLILQGDPAAPALSVPTPTFGRFPILTFGEQPMVVGAFADTFVRVAVPVARWERVLEALVRGQGDEALLADLRALLAGKATDPNDVYVALEVLGLLAQETDRAAAEAVLVDPRFADARRYRVRIAAAQLLANLGGEASVRRLLTLVEQDEVLAVRSAAAAALGPLLKRVESGSPAVVREAAETLARLALDASSEPIRPASASDPRENQLDGVLGAILKTLGTVRARAGIPPALRALERVDDGDALVAGLTFFTALNEPDQAGAVAWRMREKDAEDAYFNPLFVRTLQALTGQRLGDDRAAWVRWCRERALLPSGHDAPLGPEAPPGGEPR